MPPAEIGFVDAMRTTFGNRQFLAFLPTFSLFALAFEMLVGVLPFYAVAVVGATPDKAIDALDTVPALHGISGALSEKFAGDGQPGTSVGSWASYLSTAAFVAAIAMIPVAKWHGRRTSKRHAYRVSMLGAAAIFPLVGLVGLVPVIPPTVQALGAMLLVGLPITGNYLFPVPLIADIVDDDSLRTDMRREGTYFGAQNFVEKTVGALTPLVLMLLFLFGRTSSDPLGARLVGPVAGLLVFIGWLSFRRYDLSDDVLGDAAAAAERGGESVQPTPPPSG